MLKRIACGVVNVVLAAATLSAQTRTYTKSQISSGAFNHESPSINNHGDVVWCQQAGGFWQVYILRVGTAVAALIGGQAPDHNNTNPAIDDAGDVMYLKDGVGQGVALAVILNKGGVESTIEFSSQNSLTGQHRDAGQRFGIAGNGTTISYFDFLQFGAGPRRFDVSGVGQLPGDFGGDDFPDINSNGTFVYSSFGSVFSAAVSAPGSPTAIASGDKPRIADLVPPATVPEVVYISGGSQVVSTLGGTIDAGLWADVNKSGAVVYEKQVDGFDQIFLAINGCGHPTFTDPYPTSSSPAPIGDPNVWHMSYNVSDQHGLELTDVSLGSRYMAETMNLPYLYLQTSGFSNTRCTLTPGGDPTLGAACTSHLIDFLATAGAVPEIKATYEIDNISAAGQNACVLITQDYQFTPPIYPALQGVQGCEPSDTLACAKFKPLVSYQFFPGDTSDTLTRINTAQQLHFTVNGLRPNSSAVFKDCDTPLIACNGLLFQNKINPLPTEIYANGILGGGLGTWDNFHQTFNPTVQEPVIDFTTDTISGAGCPECVHIHWRWGKWANAFGLQNFGGGNPLLLNPASNQDVYFATVAWHPGEQDPNSITNLVNGEPLNPADTVFWYSATGYQDHDTFFNHGGFFSPPSSGPAKLTISVVGQSEFGGSLDVTLQVANTGPGTAHDVVINQLLTKVLKGTGTVSITTPIVPIFIGDLAAASHSSTVVVTIPIPSAAREFLLQEGISFTDDFGTIQGTSFGEIIIP